MEVSSGAELVAVLLALKTAVETGELDAQITAAAEAVKARFGKQ